MILVISHWWYFDSYCISSWYCFSFYILLVLIRTASLMSRVMRKAVFCISEKKKTISAAQLISTFVYATFQASCHLLWLYSPVCVGPGQKPRRPVFSQQGSYNFVENFRKSFFHFHQKHNLTFFLVSALL